MNKIKKHLFLLIFILTFCVFFKVDAKINELPLMGKTIYVDAGHGGTPNTKWIQMRFNAL